MAAENNMIENPIATVLMPVYNGEKYLREAIDSILNQSYKDFEFLIINDGSTDSTEEIIQSYTDERIVYVKNETNIKLISTLNKGIALSKGRYIIRMDADDISLSARIEEQVDFMEKNPLVGLCGSYIRTVGLGEKDCDIKYETTHEAIKFRLLFDTHFPHPAAIIRKKVLTDYNLSFEAQYLHCEDFALWNKMAQVCRLAIIPAILVLKRDHADQISTKYKKIQDTISSEIRRELLIPLLPDISPEFMDLYDQFLKGNAPDGIKEQKKLLDAFDKLIIANRSVHIYDQKLFESFFKLAYWDLCLASTQSGLVIYNKYSHSICGKEFPVARKNRLGLLIKSLLHYKDRNFHLPIIIE